MIVGKRRTGTGNHADAVDKNTKQQTHCATGLSNQGEEIISS
ncbi:hypothetical protein [Herbaspirillum hiltneri]|nr:hypothetical protein [Herbaspirillum hiltneri]